MAKVLVFTPDLLFGSSLIGALVASGHGASLCQDKVALEAEGSGSVCVIVDLTDDVAQRLADLKEVQGSGALDGSIPIGYYSHVDPESRDLGLAAGLLKVVPRSRMHREPAALVDSALSL